MCQNVADFTGFERPTTVIDNTDPIARQLLALAQREGKQLMRVSDWAILKKNIHSQHLMAQQLMPCQVILTD